MKQKGNKLYNVLFPIWMLALFPQTWIIVLPANFLIDLCVMWLALKYIKVAELKETIKSTILKVWIAGFTADFIGGIAMFSANLLDIDYQTAFGKWWYNELSSPVMYNPFETIYAFLWATICVLISVFFIYILNKKWCLKNTNLTSNQKHKLALAIAVFTAPYLFYLPSEWFW